MKSNGLDIDVEPLQLIYDLKLTLESQGIFLFNTIKPGTDNIQFSCPSHKDGQEHKPSCGMVTLDKFKGGKKIEAGTVHCFACGYTASLSEFISFCFGFKDGGIFGNKWLKMNYTTALLDKHRTFNLEFKRNKPTTTQYKTIGEDILDTFRYYHSYMYKRGLTDEIIELFDVGFDRDDNSITFPVADFRGNIKWIQTRSVTTKFYKIPEGINKTDFIYGAYQALTTDMSTDKVYIVESIFNCLTLWKLGKVAIALFGTGGGRQYDLLSKLPFRHYVLALDNDDAGIKGKNILINKLKRKKLLSQVKYGNSSKDINELDTQFLTLPIQPINF